MRYFIIIILLLNTSLIQAQYCPLLEEDKNWFFTVLYGESGGQISTSYIVNVEGDTIINNVAYKKLLRRELAGEHPCQSPPCFVPFIPYQVMRPRLYAILREDTTEQKVYCLKENSSANPDIEEFLLFDFSVNTGDTLSSFIRTFIAADDLDSSYGIVDSITTETIIDKERKVINTWGLIPTNGLGFFDKILLIEGIGLWAFDVPGFGEGIGFFPRNDTFMFDYCEGDYNDCNIILSNNEIDDSINVTVSPNPTNGIFSISSNKLIENVELHDMTGSIMGVFTDDQIDTSSYPDGMYLVKFLFKDETVSIKKLVKN